MYGSVVNKAERTVFTKSGCLLFIFLKKHVAFYLSKSNKSDSYSVIGILNYFVYHFYTKLEVIRLCFSPRNL